MNRSTAKAQLSLVLVVALGITTAVIPSVSAFAHAQLLVSSPAVGATLYSAPQSVTLTFDDDLIDLQGGNEIVVTDPKNHKVDVGNTLLQGSKLSIQLKKLTLLGKYEVTYHVISNDGHPVTNQFPFYLAKKPTKKTKG
jgi:copper resistance protein C